MAGPSLIQSAYSQQNWRSSLLTVICTGSFTNTERLQLYNFHINKWPNEITFLHTYFTIFP
jgi:hypothetical protein